MTAPFSRPTVALVAHGIHDTGGMERAFAELVRRLVPDYKIIVVSARLDKNLRSLVEWRRVPTPPRPLALKFPWFFLAGAVRLARIDADIVHVLGAIVPTRADVACVQFCHAGFIRVQGGLSPPDSPAMRRINTTITRWFALHAERWSYKSGRLSTFAAVSTGVAQELSVHYPTVPIAITPNGVDVQRYRPDNENRRRVRTSNCVTDEMFVALFVGGDWGRKGLAIAIDAVAEARRAGAPVNLWVVGRGDNARFEEIARCAGVLEHVCFFGPQDRTEIYFQAADAFVLPTLYETFSLVAYEAAATGLPVIATAVSGVDDLLRDDKAGILVQRNAVDISDALVKLWSDAKLRAQLGTSGRARTENYTWDQAEVAVRRLYTTLLNANVNNAETI